MNAQEEMQKIVEAADECWHTVEEFAGETMGHYYFECTTCGVNDRGGDNFPSNPSPTDLNELYWLVGKLGFDSFLWRNNQITLRGPNKPIVKATAIDFDDALRKALVKAVEGKG
jgi:hypothetical protein